MADAFISYSRRDAEFVTRLSQALKDQGKDCWIDVDGIRAGEVFPAVLRSAIESSDAFVFVISPDSVSSPYCIQEVEHAVGLNKRVVPVVFRAVPDERVPEGIRERHWIPFADDDAFEPGMRLLVEALETDLELLRRHTRLLVRALEWDAANRDRSLLLRGSELAAAETWLGEAAGRQPEPTTLQREYLDAGRRAASRRLRAIAGASGVVAVVATGLLVFALISRQQANVARDRADIARVAAVSRSVVERQPDLGLLLAVAAFELDDNVETRGALLGGLQTNPLLFGLLHGVDSGLEAAVFSPDGSKLVTPTTDGTGSIVWSTASRRRLAVLDHGNGILQDAAISPSGRWLAVPAIYEKPKFDSSLQVWDLARKRLVRLIHSPAGGLSSAAFSADGDTLITQGGPRITGRFGTEVVLWDARTWRPRGDPLLVNPEYSGDRTVAVSADGELLAVPLSNGGVRVWSSSARKVVATLPPTTAPVTALAFAPNASSLAIGDDGGGVRFLDPRTARSRAKPLALSESSAVAIEYSPDGSRVAVGRQDGRTQIFDLESGEQLGPPLAANASAINDVSFSADGSLLATAGLDRTGALWRLDGNRAIGTVFRGQEGPITQATYTPDGRLVLTAGADGSVAAREPGTGSILRRFRLGGEVLSAAVSPDGSTLAAGGTGGRVALWPIDDPSADPVSVDLDGSWAQQVAFSPDGRQLAVAVDGARGAWELGGSGHVRFVDPATGAETAARLKFHGGLPIGVAFSPDGEVLAVTADNNLVQLYDARTHARIGKPLANVDASMLATAFAPGLAAARDRYRLRLRAAVERPLADRRRAAARGRSGRDRRSRLQPRWSAPGDQPGRLVDDPAVAGGQRSPVRRHVRRRGPAVHRADVRPRPFRRRPSHLLPERGSAGHHRARPRDRVLDPGSRQWRDAACAIAGRELSEGEWRQYLPDRDPYPLCAESRRS